MGMEHGFSTPRSDAFPAGLRVLVVDDDPTWLKILEKMLKKCCYEVTTCGLAREALKLLRDRKDGFDIVISDVNMPDMDGFRLLEHVGLEMDLPVIMMSVDGETKRVMKGVQHGACDYLLKPIRMKELKNIWQHVVRKRMHDVIDIEYFEDRSDHSQNGHYGGDQNFLKKRKEVDNEKDTSDPSNSKKARVVWTVDLHKKFVEAVNQLGIDSDKIGPKKILDLMNVPWLTRENVASHLQKYRLYLSRLRKEDKMESSCCGIKNQDHSPKDSSGSFSLQTSSFGLQNDITSKCFYQGNQLPVHTVDSEILDSNPESNMSLPLTENRITFRTKNCDSHTSRTSQLSFNHTYGSSDMSIKHASFDSPVSGRHPWRGEVADRLQFESDLKPHSNLENCFTQPTVPIMPQCINSDLLEPAPCVSPTPSISENNSISLIDIKPSNSKGGVNNTGELSPMKISLGSFSVSNTDAFGCVYDMKTPSFSHDVSSIKDEPLLEGSLQSFPVHLGCHLAETQGLEPIGFDATLEMKKQISCQGNIIGQSSVVGSESEPRNQGLGSESAYGLLSEDLMFRWLQYGDITRKDFGVDYIGFQGCYFPEFDFVTSLPPYEYVPKLDNECLHDWGDGGIFS